MYGVRPPPRLRMPGTITAVQVVMGVKAGLMLYATGMLCLGIVMAMFGENGDGVETWMIGALIIVAPVGATYLAVAVRLGKGREWARITALVLEGVTLFGALAAMMEYHDYILLSLAMAGSITVICCAPSRSAAAYCRARSGFTHRP